jgi:hypothetical protein
VSTTQEVAVSESTENQTDETTETDEKAQKPGEEDTETVAGYPKEAPKSKQGEQSKQDE